MTCLPTSVPLLWIPILFVSKQHLDEVSCFATNKTGIVILWDSEVIVIDACIFYEMQKVWLDNARPSSNGWKRTKSWPNFFKNAQYYTVKTCTRHKINPASQLCTACSTAEDNQCQFGNHRFNLYKKGLNLWVNFFDFYKLITCPCLFL